MPEIKGMKLAIVLHTNTHTHTKKLQKLFHTVCYPIYTLAMPNAPKRLCLYQNKNSSTLLHTCENKNYAHIELNNNHIVICFLAVVVFVIKTNANEWCLLNMAIKMNEHATSFTEMFSIFFIEWAMPYQRKTR